jgi:hypothetical protein
MVHLPREPHLQRSRIRGLGVVIIADFGQALRVAETRHGQTGQLDPGLAVRKIAANHTIRTHAHALEGAFGRNRLGKAVGRSIARYKYVPE